jgi:hypothetical protein
MKRFSTKLLICFLIIFSGTLRAEDTPKYLQIDFNISSLSEEDRDLVILQEFYFYSILSQIAKDQDSIIVNQEGEFSFKGTEEQFTNFLDLFSQKLEQEFSFEEFVFAKEEFLQKLQITGALFERNLVEEIEWKHLHQARIEMEKLVRHLESIKRSEVQVMNAPASNIQPYYHLRLTHEDQKNIEKLIKKLADLNVFELLLKKKEMEKLGDKIQPVHPLRFIGYIYSCPDLKKRLSKIHDNYFKWKNFIGGFGDRMSLEFSRNNLTSYLPGFSHFTGIPLQKVESYVQRKDWDGLVISMM